MQHIWRGAPVPTQSFYPRRTIEVPSPLEPSLTKSWRLSQLPGHCPESTGEEKTLALVKQVSPVAWTNVNLNGTYSFSFEQGMINLADILSPLRGENQGSRE